MNFWTKTKTVSLLLCLSLTGCGYNKPFEAVQVFEVIDSSTFCDSETGVIYFRGTRIPLYNSDGSLKTIKDSEYAQERLIEQDKYLYNINDNKTSNKISVKNNNTDKVSIPNNIGISINKNQIETKGYFTLEDYSIYHDFSIEKSNNKIKYMIDNETYTEDIDDDFEIYIEYINDSEINQDKDGLYYFVVDDKDKINVLNNKTNYPGKCTRIGFYYNDEDNELINNENVEDPNGNYYYHTLSCIILTYHIN